MVPEEDPRKSKWVSSDDNKEFYRSCMECNLLILFDIKLAIHSPSVIFPASVHLGHRDCDEIFYRACTRPLPAEKKHGKGSFMTIYAVLVASSFAFHTYLI